MNFIHQRYSAVLENGGSTQSILNEKLDDSYPFFCHIIEDEPRAMDKIVRGETRIPSGLYELVIHNIVTPKTELYRTLKGFEWFEFFLEIVSPGKTYIEYNGKMVFGLVFIHNGNGERDTDACICLNDSMGNNTIDGTTPPGARSNQAMKRFYDKVYPYKKSGGKVLWEVRDEIKLWKP